MWLSDKSRYLAGSGQSPTLQINKINEGIHRYTIHETMFTCLSMFTMLIKMTKNFPGKVQAIKNTSAILSKIFCSALPVTTLISIRLSSDFYFNPQRLMPIQICICLFICQTSTLLCLRRNP